MIIAFCILFVSLKGNQSLLQNSSISTISPNNLKFLVTFMSFYINNGIVVSFSFKAEFYGVKLQTQYSIYIYEHFVCMKVGEEEMI